MPQFETDAHTSPIPNLQTRVQTGGAAAPGQSHSGPASFYFSEHIGFWHSASRPTLHEWVFNKRFGERYDAPADVPELVNVSSFHEGHHARV